MNGCVIDPGVSHSTAYTYEQCAASVTYHQAPGRNVYNHTIAKWCFEEYLLHCLTTRQSHILAGMFVSSSSSL